MSTAEEQFRPAAGREAVAAEVRVLMARHRTRQEDLAGELDMSQQALSRRLRCVTPFDVDDLFGIADFYRVDIKRLFGEDLATGRYPQYAQVSPALDLVHYVGPDQLTLDDAPRYDDSPAPLCLVPLAS